jgi:hypothetical protein
LASEEELPSLLLSSSLSEDEESCFFLGAAFLVASFWALFFFSSMLCFLEGGSDELADLATFLVGFYNEGERTVGNKNERSGWSDI